MCKLEKKRFSLHLFLSFLHRLSPSLINCLVLERTQKQEKRGERQRCKIQYLRHHIFGRGRRAMPYFRCRAKWEIKERRKTSEKELTGKGHFAPQKIRIEEEGNSPIRLKLKLWESCWKQKREKDERLEGERTREVIEIVRDEVEKIKTKIGGQGKEDMVNAKTRPTNAHFFVWKFELYP